MIPHVLGSYTFSGELPFDFDFRDFLKPSKENSGNDNLNGGLLP